MPFAGGNNPIASERFWRHGAKLGFGGMEKVKLGGGAFRPQLSIPLGEKRKDVHRLFMFLIFAYYLLYIAFDNSQRWFFHLRAKV